MAFNFPASVAACLAAAGGFKVPRQLAMYCIAQDTGTPYMLYKDGMERGTMQVHGQGGNGQVGLVGGQWGPGPPHQPSENGYVTQSTPGSNPGPGPGPGPGTGPGPGPGPGSPTDSLVQHSANDAESTAPVQQPPEQHPSITPPVPSPYADQSQPQQSQQQPPHPPQVNGEDDTSVTVNSQPPQVTTNSPPLQESTVERQCFSTQTDMSQSYYVRGTHMLSPGSFMSYLKQPGGVMLTQLNSSESGSEFASGMPDLLSAQQGKLVKQGSDLRLFKCLTCGKDFKQKSTLLQHERIHTDSRPYGCSECGKRFRQQSHLTQHLRIHANEKPFACVYCERTFRQRAILNQHLRIHSGEKPFSCSECGKRFRQKAILNQHVRTHQDVSPHLVYKNGQLWPQDVPFPADKDPVYDNGDGCFSPESTTQFPAYFKDSKGMTHGVFGQGKVLPDIIQHGRSAGMPLYVRCPICQKEFKQKSTLLQHGCIHIESRPYPCGECGKRFRQQSHLTQHLRIHTNEKPYACIYCGRNFRQRTILNQHLRIHTGEKPYKCPQCGKDFRQKAILDQHTRTHQGDRPYCCPMPNCRRRFSTEQEVKRHIDNHMNPHASKRRTEIKHRVPSPPAGMAAGATAIVKPELYFPQCYAPSPAFTHHQYTTASAGVQDFKSPPPTTVVQ